MKQILFFLLIICAFAPKVSAQDPGVRFEKGVEWKQVVKKAKKVDLPGLLYLVVRSV